MKKFMLLMIALFIGCSFNQIFAQNSNTEERNKQIAVKYHELDPNDIDDVLAVDFVGHWNENEGKSFSIDVMQFMKIKNGKIVEIWELFNQDQLAALNE